MSPLNDAWTGPTWWRSLEERAGDPAVRRHMEREFAQDNPAAIDETGRREFLKLIGASAALAGMTACRWPREEILPFARRPEGRVPGVASHYATAMELGGVAQGLVVTSYDGRPIKIEGNPDHPLNAGATGIHAQASILDLYDPDRSRGPSRRDGAGRVAAEWGEAEADLLARRPAFCSGRGRLAVLAEASSSPTLARLRRALAEACPGSRWYEYEAISRDNERSGARLAFGQALAPRYDLARADVIVALEADLLNDHPAALRHAREFAARRRADDGTMNRLVVLESAYSVTGAMADHRHALPARAIATAAGQLAAAVLGPLLGLPRGLAQALARTQGRAEVPFVAALARELAAHRGRSLVIAGPGQPPEVHALAHLVNEALGNVGRTVSYAEVDDPDRPAHVEAIARLTESLATGEVDTLLVIGGNPARDAPADLRFASALALAGASFHLSERENETSKACDWHLNRAHYLESWGDARSDDGTVSIVQPLIEPLFGGRGAIEIVALLAAGRPEAPRGLVRETARAAGYARTDAAFERALRDGLAAGSARPARSPRVDRARLSTAIADWRPPAGPAPGEGVELMLRADPKLLDGRYANNAWLQELPEPLTKIAWDNALLLSEPTARRLGLRSHETARVEAAGASVEVPVFVMPGHAADSATLWLGQGSTSAGRVGNGLGVDAYPLRTTDAMHVRSDVTVRPTGRAWRVATQQDYHAIDTLGLAETLRREPELLREGTLAEYLEQPDFVEHRSHLPHLNELWKPHEYDGYKWGMAIDLTACIGCAACVVACQAENNIPSVGKQEVLRGRDMHWIRVDRYFSGTADDARVAFQPVTCHHCENAPCEQVCPVAATLHNDEGLNQMVYNRCIGTRYCSNNCPYKVRRFNFWNNQKHTTPLEALRHNPEVTVRSRGVMEKCTYCVQRIEGARSTARLDDRRIQDGDVTPACAQACPTRAIVFGDLNDAGSRVAAQHAHRRSYAMLAELRVVPRTRYLARLTNPRDAKVPHGTAHGGDSGPEHH